MGGGGQREGRPGACCEKLLLQLMKEVGEGCIKSKMNLDWAEFDLESPKTILLGLPRPQHQIIHFLF